MRYNRLILLAIVALSLGGCAANRAGEAYGYCLRESRASCSQALGYPDCVPCPAPMAKAESGTADGRRL